MNLAGWWNLVLLLRKLLDLIISIQKLSIRHLCGIKQQKNILHLVGLICRQEFAKQD
nr:MAG TPA: hypothetical protein [Caudoviricetes sp.]